MGLEADFLEVMNHRVVIQRLSTEDADGNNTYGTAVTLGPDPGEVQCRIDSDTRGRPTGEQRGNRQDRSDPSYEVVLITDYIDPPFGTQDRVTMPDDTHVYVVTVEVEYDETTEPHHLVINCNTGKEL